jgi:hypothetical protein
LKYQQELDDFYTDSVTSPLTPEERAAFHRHEFFSYNPEMAVEANIEVLENEPWFNMATSSGVIESTAATPRPLSRCADRLWNCSSTKAKG